MDSETARRVSTILLRTAEALEQSAALADKHAARRRDSGEPDEAAFEARAAERARSNADRARSRAGDLTD